jgi:hypothetical protein
LRQITVRVDQTKPLSILEILAHELRHQRGLARSSLTEDGDMVQAVLGFDTEGAMR